MKIQVDGVRIALGAVGMFEDAIHRHWRESHSKYPMRLVMHPNVYNAMASDLLNAGMFMHGGPISVSGQPQFHGIPIFRDKGCDRPYLVTWDNQISYI